MRLTDEQKERLAKAAGADLVDAIVACILRLDEEAEPVHPSHLTTVVESRKCERDEARAERDEARSELAEVERERDTALAMLDEAERERDEAKADLDALARAVAQALMVPTLTDREELVDPSDHAIVGAMLGLRNARDTALARLAKVVAERAEARAKLAEVGRLLAIEEQAKRVARAEMWLKWAHRALIDADRSPLHLVRVDEAMEWVERCQVCLVEARFALSSERRKLAEMVGEL